jgi:hypothetical protein
MNHLLEKYLSNEDKQSLNNTTNDRAKYCEEFYFTIFSNIYINYLKSLDPDYAFPQHIGAGTAGFILEIKPNLFVENMNKLSTDYKLERIKK